MKNRKLLPILRYIIMAKIVVKNLVLFLNWLNLMEDIIGSKVIIFNLDIRSYSNLVRDLLERSINAWIIKEVRLWHWKLLKIIKNIPTKLKHKLKYWISSKPKIQQQPKIVYIFEIFSCFVTEWYILFYCSVWHLI